MTEEVYNGAIGYKNNNNLVADMVASISEQRTLAAQSGQMMQMLKSLQTTKETE